MGQQQLLLLVLATVIVGLATVAGIEAFDQNQAQAAQDALTQKGVEIASNIKGLDDKPTQMGGIDIVSESDPADIGRRLGLGDASVDVPGAGGGACTIKNPGADKIDVECSGGDAPSVVTVTYNASKIPQVSTATSAS